jgi:membrane-bound metal-dependent hydrolase YbcI (DUF457 family)
VYRDRVFLGHFAVGFAATRVAPRAPLPALIAAPILLDLLWPIGLLTGLESVRVVPGITPVTPLDLHDYPYTHSLAMAVVWSLVFALGYLAFTKGRDRRGALVIGLGVASHWLLDFVTHIPDMPLYPGHTDYVGLGLWRSLPGTLAVEAALFVAGVGLYATATRPRSRWGSIALWSLVAFLVVAYAGSLGGPPPPSAQLVAIGALATWIFIPWAWWIDRTRERIA